MSESWSSVARLSVWAWGASLAACISLAPLVDTNGFLWAGAVAGAAVLLVGVVGRKLHLPVPLVIVLQLVVLLEWATLSYAASEAWGGLVPTRESLGALVDLVASALATAREYAPPAPADQGVEGSLALVVGGIVLLVDLVAVSWRRPALVGLVFLGVYMAPVSLLAGEVPVVSFVPGALAFVFLLGAEQRDRVSHWGRQLGSSGVLLGRRDRERVTVSTLIQSGRRVGLAAVALAVVVPVVVPTFPRTFLADGPLTGEEGGRRLGAGDGTVEIDNPMLDLRRNLGDRSEQVLVTVTTDGSPPEYLRLAALDTFTGTSWQPSPRDPDNATALAKIGAPPGLTTFVDRERVDAEVRISESFSTSWLPTVYPVTTAEVRDEDDEAWSVDADELDISTEDDDVDGAGMSYRFTSTLVLPTAEELAQTPAATDELSRYLELPDVEEMPAVIAATAAEVSAGAGSRFAQAQALQDWFRRDGGFTYSVAPGKGDGLSTIALFLTEERVGYCEQFAAAMALMARTLGIPSRVAVGFLRPERGAANTWVYRGVDMHAWPELYFEGVGWVRFEPTPAARTGAAPSFVGLPGTESQDPQFPDQDLSALPGETPTPTLRDDAADGAGGGSDGWGIGVPLTLGTLLLLLVLAVAPRTARSALRTRRWRLAGPAGTPVPEVAWRELCGCAVDLGVRVDPAATVRASGRGLRRLVDDTPAAVTALNRLVVDVERSRFARGSSRAGRPAADSHGDVEQVLSRMAASRSGAQRWRAVWLPVSLLPGGLGGGLVGSTRRRLDRRNRSRHGSALLRAEEQAGG